MLPDMSTLLAPISPKNPAGDNLEYDPLFDEIRDARESDPDYLPQDAWSVSEPRKADWNRVRILSEKALSERSKDLQLACWFVEALCHQHGLAGLVAAMEFLSEFITRFWFQCWPSLEEEGIAIRRSKLLRLDRELSQQLFRKPLLRQADTTLVRWRQILAFEHKLNTQPDKRDELIHQEGDLTQATFDRQAANFSSIEIAQQASVVEQLGVAFDQLEERYASLSQDLEGELFSQTRQMLADLTDYLQRLTQRAIPPADDFIALAPMPEEGAPEFGDAPSCSMPSGMNRELAINQMLSIAGYFRQAEPSSPVPFLMERAARWANMTLSEWLEEMLNDSNSMNEINNVLTGRSR